MKLTAHRIVFFRPGSPGSTDDAVEFDAATTPFQPVHVGDELHASIFEPTVLDMVVVARVTRVVRSVKHGRGVDYHDSTFVYCEPIEDPRPSAADPVR